MRITNLNAAIAGTDMEGKTIENILINLDMKTCLFVTMAVVLQSQLILDSYDSNGGLPTGDLLAAIEAAFGTLKNLKLFQQSWRDNLVLDGLWCVQKAEKLKFVVLQTKTIH
jgi:Fe-Mn family superoxide dismutase